MENSHDITIPHALASGIPLLQASRVLVMLHGRGSSAEDILGLADHLQVGNFSLLAVGADNHSWYPYSFLAPREQNEPWLSASLARVHGVVEGLLRLHYALEQLYFLGFSQGACLMLEYMARHGARYGGAIAFTGGLIGERVDKTIYQGNFKDTPVFIGTSDPDMHVPVERVRESEAVLKEMGCELMVKVYPGMGHTISQDEIRSAERHVLGIANR